jgi:AcrR family transcriptional regulator
MTRKPTEVRQEEIKKAVLEIIRTDGIKSLSTKNLSIKTGISEGAIFRHFKTKRDIILSIINDVSVDLIGNLREIAFGNKNPKERFFDYLCNTINYLTENNGITILIFTEASHSNDEEMMEKLNYIFDSQRELAGKIISDGMSMGIWNDALSVEDITMLYMGIPITHNINLVLKKGKELKRDYCNKMMSLIGKILEK